MCGITGFIDPKLSVYEPNKIIRAMTDKIIHRGPDGEGHWISDDKTVALGHRRLSIHDLSNSGQQPMASKCQRYMMVFNGEIYNFLQLKEELINKGHSFSGQSDTEVLLQLISEFGFTEALKQTEGMFSIALFDTHNQTISFARDRMGEKPLYIGSFGSMIIFGSELKVFKAIPDWESDISNESLSYYFEYGYIPTPLTIYKDVIKLSPGVTLTLDTKSHTPLKEWQEVEYWSLKDTVESINKNKCSLSVASNKLEVLLVQSIKDQLSADVPLGMFLSGGIDSSTVVAIAQSISKEKIKTFSIGFEEDSFNEAPFAREVANILKTDHTELYCSPEMVKKSIHEISKHYDEPFSDASQLPTMVLCKLARQHVTVCLSGDGGDELFHGYSRFFRATKRRNQVLSSPKPIKVIAKLLASILNPKAFSKDIFQKLALIFERISKIDTPSSFYRTFIARRGFSNSLVLNRIEPKFLFAPPSKTLTFEEIMRFSDMRQYLTDDILVKVDRASMASSLEVRVPLLNHKIVEFSWTLENSNLFLEDKGKLPLREILKKYLPSIDFDRPKKGFGVPLASWLKSDLKDWAYDLLFGHPQLIEKNLDINVLKKIWNQHQNNKRDYSCELWDTIVLVLWLKNEKIHCD